MGDDSGFDLILAGGRVIDGTGAPGRPADVSIRGDRIAAVGDLSACAAARRKDVTSLTVTPGFIDTHTHDDSALRTMPDMPFAISQGVTTVVVGNCGMSLAPLLPEAAPPRPLDLLGDRSGFRFPRVADYLAALDAAPSAVNAVCLVGHTTLRAGALAWLDRPADPGELRAMAGQLAEALEVGAAGLSSGVYYDTARRRAGFRAGGAGARHRACRWRLRDACARRGGRHPRGDGGGVRGRSVGRSGSTAPPPAPGPGGCCAGSDGWARSIASKATAQR